MRDVRELQLPRGRFDLRFMDIAATVNPATVHFRSLTEPSRVNVLEQNYEYDLLEPDKLLRKYVGRDVVLVRRRSENGPTREEEVTAHLVSYNNAPVWQIGGEIVTGMSAARVLAAGLAGRGGTLSFPLMPVSVITSVKTRGDSATTPLAVRCGSVMGTRTARTLNS